MDDRPRTDEPDERPEPRDPLLDGPDVPEETPSEDVVPDDVGRDDRPRTGTDTEPPLP